MSFVLIVPGGEAAVERAVVELPAISSYPRSSQRLEFTVRHCVVDAVGRAIDASAWYFWKDRSSRSPYIYLMLIHLLFNAYTGPQSLLVVSSMRVSPF